MKKIIDLVKLWINKAEHDLITAENSMTIKPEPPLDTICFHAQQCAEKYIKAFLIYHNIEFKKTHNLGDLVLLASQIDKDFKQIEDVSENLTPYAVDTRYPGLLDDELTDTSAKEAIKECREIKKFILAKLPKFK